MHVGVAHDERHRNLTVSAADNPPVSHSRQAALRWRITISITRGHARTGDAHSANIAYRPDTAARRQSSQVRTRRSQSGALCGRGADRRPDVSGPHHRRCNRRSTLHGPAPAADRYRNVKQNMIAMLPPLRMGQKFAGLCARKYANAKNSSTPARPISDIR